MSYAPMAIEEKRRLARVVADMRNAMLVGHRAPVVEQMWERHTDPQPGDWVVETSTLPALLMDGGVYRSSGKWTDAKIRDLWDGQFTRYLRSETRTHLDEGDEWSEVVHICENPDGTEYAWTNAELAVVPIDRSLVGLFAPR